MLKSIFIKDYLLISELSIDFESGLTVVTGETGSGKSLVVDSLALVLGARARSDVVRRGCNSAEIIAVFSVTRPEIRSWLEEAALEDDDECIIRRLIYTARPSRSYINGRPVTLQNVRNLASQFVEIHGQHEHQTLSKQSTQRHLLDAFIGHLEQVKALSNLATEIRKKKVQQIQLIEKEQEIRSSLEFFRFQHDELTAVSPQADEFTELKVELARVSHADELVRELNDISHQLFYADGNTVSSTLSEVSDRISQLQNYDERLSSLSELLQEAVIRVDESAREMNAIADLTELDPMRIETLQSRMSELHRLARIHQAEPDKLQEVQTELAKKIEEFESELSVIQSFDTNFETLKTKYRIMAEKIRTARMRAAPKFSTAVSQQLQLLGMTGARFKINLVDSQKQDFLNFGYENVEFLISTNPGQTMGTIGNVASGGELSRISLAVQVVAADNTQVPTVIFDEIDVGIGGGIAECIGKLLRELGQIVQIICITHLAQVAAQGHFHLNVTKTSDQDSTVKYQLLNHNQRISEIARMMGGVKITSRTKEHAKEMLSKCK